MSTTTIALLVILITVIDGILGGFINYYQSATAADSIKSRCYYVLLSIGAAFIVPLFLSLAKSNILTNIFSAKLNLEDWFVFFGACVIAAIYAKAFLETVSQKFLKMAEDAKNAANAANRKSDELAAAQNKQDKASENVENKADDAAKKAFQARPAPAVDLNAYGANEQKVLEALMSPAFPLGRRSLGGIASEAKLDRTAVTAILDKLIAAGVVREVAGERTGNIFYELAK